MSKEVENVSERVKRTKKEVEQLKNELDQLINLGAQSSKFKQKLHQDNKNIEPPPLQLDEKVIHQSSAPRVKDISNHKIPTNKKPPAKEPPPPVKEPPLPCKNRSPEAIKSSREYIKKQKEKRAEQLKAQIKMIDNKVDLKKQKLRELHQKALDLVNKNVQKNRERSKSRDRDGEIWLDKANPRQKSQERFKPTSQEPRQKSQDRIKQNVSQQRQKSQTRIEQKTQTSNQRERSREGNIRMSRPQVRNHAFLPKDIDTNYLYPQTLDKGEEITDEKTIMPLFDDKIEPTSQQTQKSEEKVSSHSNLPETLHKTHRKQRNKVLEHSVMTDACHMDTKETQTHQERKFEEPVWLQPSPVLPYPYNFITTVKRKLRDAINSPRISIEMPERNSEEVSNLKSQTPDNDKLKTKSEIRELLIKSTTSNRNEVKSFASHKRPNLDLKAVENLGLKPKSNSNRDAVSKNLFEDFSSESDTSKNIPDISSESVGFSKGTGSEPVLSLDKLKNLKLNAPLKNSSKETTVSSKRSTINTISNGYPENNDSYSSDFIEESEFNKKFKSADVKTETINTVYAEKKQNSILSLIPANSNKDKDESHITEITDQLTNPTVTATDQLLKKSDGSSKKSFKSLLTEGQISSTTQSISTEKVNRSLTLTEPSVSLNFKKTKIDSNLLNNNMKNITIRPASSTNNNVNEIHLKFEAEVRLLNDFNESIKQFMTVEKAFEHLKNQKDNNQVAVTKIVHNADTQTSIMAKTLSNVTSEEKLSKSINFSRGSEIIEEFNDSDDKKSIKSLQNNTFSTTGFDLSNLSNFRSANSTADDNTFKFSISNVENYNVTNCAGLSLNMFEQLIKDEDSRIQHLKAIIKIREQALLDRTKGELVWLEIQRKQLIETGKIEEASLLKKKQRGIIVKHEQERNEIKKLKQMQKEASEERKNILKQQRNLIKSQLSTKNMLSKIKVKAQKERRSSGPLRVVQSCSESVHSETSVSRRSSVGEDIISITSSHSVRISEVESSDLDAEKEASLNKTTMPVSNAKRTLFMREAALQKRRKAAEELLRWHRKLLDEEKKIAELEAAATSVIKRIPKESEAVVEKYKFSGKQLNQLWKNMTGRDDRKFVEDKIYMMSQITLERLCKSARQYANETKKLHAKISEPSTDPGVLSDTAISESGLSVTVKKVKEPPVQNEDAIKTSPEDKYSSLFDPESVQEIINSQEEKTKISSISELIDNFSKIEDEISLLGKKSEHDIISLKENTETVPANELSNKTSLEVVENLETISRTSSESSQIPIDEISVLETQHSTDNQMTKSDSSDRKPSPINTEREKLTSSHEISTEDFEKHKLDDRVNEIESAIPSLKEESDKIVTEKLELSLKEATSSSIEEKEEDVTEEVEPIVEDQATSTTHQISETEITASQKHSEEIAAEKSKTQNEPSSEEITTEKSKTELVTKESSEQTVQGPTEDIGTEESLTPTESLSIASAPRESTEKITTETSEVQNEASTDVSELQRSTEHVAPEKSKTQDETIIISNKIETDLKTSEALEAATKIEESLIKLNEKLVGETKEVEEEISEDVQSENVSTLNEIQSIETSNEKEVLSEEQREESSVTTASDDSKSSLKSNKDETSKKITNLDEKKTTNHVDVKKRVSEILADANGHNRGDRSPRLQDLYVTAYDVGSTNPPELIEPFEDGRQLPTNIFGSEAEELWRKQLAIEQEIKQLELQQKEQLPYVFMREIPNKPPPPYTPPSSLSTSLHLSILPSSVKEVNEITNYSSKVIYKAYQMNNLENVKFNENSFKLFSKVELSKSCGEFLFNICKDIAKDHYKQFEEVNQPSWLMLSKKPQLAKSKPSDAVGLERIMNIKLKELFGFKKAQVTESAIIKWGKKKRDHVDDILVIESQEEESQWTNFDYDELIVKDQLVSDIMKMLIDETAIVFSKILSKKSSVLG